MAKKRNEEKLITEDKIVDKINNSVVDAENFEKEQNCVIGEDETADCNNVSSETNIISYDNEIVKERMEDIKASQSPKKKRKSVIINTVFLLINITLLVFIISGLINSIEGGEDLVTTLKNQGNKLWWLALGFVFYLIFIITESGIFSVLIKGTTGKRKSYLAYRVAILGKYYDNITPFAVGGQPFQIFNLTKAGIGAGISTSLPITKLIVYNLVYTAMILLFFIFGIPSVMTGYSDLGRFLMILLIAMAIIGLIVTALTSFLFLFIGNGKIVGRALARWVVRLGYKLRIVKNYRKSYNKIMIQVREYQNSMDFLKKNKGIMIKSVLLSVIQVFAYFSIPVTCILALSPSIDVSFGFWFITMTQFLICQMAGSISPLPGATGLLEIGFVLTFGSMDMLGSSVGWGLLIWRMFTYYIILIHGFIQLIADKITDVVKNKRLKKSLKNT